MKTSTENEYALNTTLGGLVDGVLQNKPDAAGKQASIASCGWPKVEASGVIAIGALVASDAAGKAKVAASGEYVVGRALTASGQDTDILTVDLRWFGYLP